MMPFSASGALVKPPVAEGILLLAGAAILAVVDEHPGRLSHFVVAAGALGGGRLLRHLLRRQLAKSAPGPDALDGPPR